MMRDTAKPV